MWSLRANSCGEVDSAITGIQWAVGVEDFRKHPSKSECSSLRGDDWSKEMKQIGMERVGSGAFDNEWSREWAEQVFGDDAGLTPEETVVRLREAALAVAQPATVNRSTLCVAVAAGEIVATCAGRGRGTLPGQVDQWVRAHGQLITCQDAWLVLCPISMMTVCGWALDDYLAATAFRKLRRYLYGLITRLDNASLD